MSDGMMRMRMQSEDEQTWVYELIDHHYDVDDDVAFDAKDDDALD